MSFIGRIGNKIRGGMRTMVIPASIILASGCANRTITQPTISPQSTTDVAQCSSIDLAEDEKRLSISLTCSMQLENESPDKIFYFFEHLDRYYLDISQGHKKFKMLNTDTLRKGALIEVEETAGGQYVRHKYRVVEVSENKSIRLVSDPSIVEIWGGFLKVRVKTTVEFEIESNTISLRLILKFRSSFLRSMAELMGTRKIWGVHIKEETEGAAKVIRSDRFLRDYKTR